MKMMDAPVDEFIVHTEFKPGVRTTLLKTRSRKRAVELTNFWDERQNTYLIEKPAATDALSVANWKFDQLIRELQHG